MPVSIEVYKYAFQCFWVKNFSPATTKMEFILVLANDFSWKLLTSVTESPILDVAQVLNTPLAVTDLLNLVFFILPVFWHMLLMNKVHKLIKNKLTDAYQGLLH